MAQHVALFVDLQGLERDGGGHRVAGIGVAVAEHAERVRFLGDRIIDVL